jgi:hypothetical protein
MDRALVILAWMSAAVMIGLLLAGCAGNPATTTGRVLGEMARGAGQNPNAAASQPPMRRHTYQMPSGRTVTCLEGPLTTRCD